MIELLNKIETIHKGKDKDREIRIRKKEAAMEQLERLAIDVFARGLGDESEW